MNHPPDRDELLDAVLAESTPADFSAALLGKTLRHARSRRRWRQARRTTAKLALLVVLGAGVWRASISHSPTERRSAMGCEIIGTQNLSDDVIVSTRPFGPDRTVATFASVEPVRTMPALANIRFLSDDELLALTAPRLPALVRTGTHTQELIFLVPGEPEAGRIN